MAVAAERRVRAERVAKDRILKTSSPNRGTFVDKKMSYQMNEPLDIGAPMPLASPTSRDDPQAPPGDGVEHVGPEPGLKKRRAMKGKVPAEIRRSASTPHIRALAHSDPSALSPTDKRRNKLGYHRTSVACGTSRVALLCNIRLARYLRCY
jgi:hypothetical protein